MGRAVYLQAEAGRSGRIVQVAGGGQQGYVVSGRCGVLYYEVISLTGSVGEAARSAAIHEEVVQFLTVDDTSSAVTASTMTTIFKDHTKYHSLQRSDVTLCHVLLHCIIVMDCSRAWIFRRLLADKLAGEDSRESLSLFIQHAQEAILACGLALVVPFLSMTRDLVCVICL